MDRILEQYLTTKAKGRFTFAVRLESSSNNHMTTSQILTDDTSFIVIDFETLTPRGRPPEPIEIAAVRIGAECQIDTKFSVNWLINPPADVPITPFDSAQTGLSYKDFKDARPCKTVFEAFAELLNREKYVFVAHNASYEAGIIRRNWPDAEAIFKMQFIDTVALAKLCLPSLANYKLDSVAYRLQETLPVQRHRAWPDAQLTARVFLRLLALGREQHKLTCLTDILKAAGLRQLASPPPPDSQMSLF
jgi:DNA polymerase-3 subunit epsilon